MTFRGEIIPQVGYVIVADDWLLESKTMRRLHNKISKNAGRAVMLIHWRTFVPLHFKQTNRQRYGHAERGKKYKRDKKRRYGSITDLVKSGRTRDYMLTLIPRIQISGSAEQLMVVHMYLKWPFPAERRGKEKITRDQMNKELATWVKAEEVFILNKYRDTYVADFRKLTRNRPKIRKRFNARMGA